MPAASAASAVMGPMQTTSGGTESRPAASTNRVTVDADVKVMASARAAAAIASGVGTAGTVRYASTTSTDHPASRRPSGTTSRATAARGSNTRPPSGGAPGNASTNDSPTDRS